MRMMMMMAMMMMPMMMTIPLILAIPQQTVGTLYHLINETEID